MTSTYSPLKFELIAVGEQDGIWGETTNVNLGTAIEQAITGSVDVEFTGADVTLTLTDTNASQVARNLRLVCTGTSGGARQLIVPSIEKQYIVQNDLADAVTIRTSAGTGILIPSGATTVVFNNGVNVVDVTNYVSLLTVGGTLVATTANATTFNGTTANVTTFNGTTANVTTFNGTTANVTTVNATTANVTTVNATNFKTTNFTIIESGDKLQFKYGATVIASMDSTGNIVSSTNITAFGTP
jgi:hypothetical protein